MLDGLLTSLRYVEFDLSSVLSKSTITSNVIVQLFLRHRNHCSEADDDIVVESTRVGIQGSGKEEGCNEIGIVFGDELRLGGK